MDEQARVQADGSARRIGEHRRTGAGAGAAIGLLFGILLDQLALGVVLGSALGLVAGATVTSAAATPPDQRRPVVAIALAILVAGLAVAGLVLTR